MSYTVILGLSLPFIGTALGAACVFLIKSEMSNNIRRFLNGFAAGVMTAASIWSLIIPAVERSEKMGFFAFVPAAVGIWAGVMFLYLIDKAAPFDETESDVVNTKKLFFAVTLHNIPEGMAVGVAYAAMLNKNVAVSQASAFALSLGIALQNFPEGSIISMPLHANGSKRGRSFRYGVLSGAVEPLFSVITILISGLIIPALPYFLSFAAGAMIYVVIRELIPEMQKGQHSGLGTLSFTLGFTVMMSLDTALG